MSEEGAIQAGGTQEIWRFWKGRTIQGAGVSRFPRGDWHSFYPRLWWELNEDRSAAGKGI